MHRASVVATTCVDTCGADRTRRPGVAAVGAGGSEPPLVGPGAREAGEPGRSVTRVSTTRDPVAIPGEHQTGHRSMVTRASTRGRDPRERRPRRRTSSGRRRRPAAPPRPPAAPTGPPVGAGDRHRSARRVARRRSASRPVNASSACRPSRPVSSTVAMSLVLSWRQPGLVDARPRRAPPPPGPAAGRAAGRRARRGWRLGSAAYAARAAARPRGRGSAVVAREPGVRDASGPADRARGHAGSCHAAMRP